jgi:hypothetical protein
MKIGLEEVERAQIQDNRANTNEKIPDELLTRIPEMTDKTTDHTKVLFKPHWNPN